MKQRKLIPLLGLGLTLFLSKPHLIYGNSGYGGGSGTESDPYLISTPEHLNQLQLDVNVNKIDTTGKYYQLVNDIDLSGSDNDSDESNGNFKPIGYRNDSTDYNYFKGIFDGNEYVISNLTIILPNQNYAGLFGYVGNANIQKLGLENVIIKGRDYVGSLIGRQEGNSGTVSQSYATGSVNGNMDVGGFIGLCRGNIHQSYALVDVSGTNYVGGFTGYQSSGWIDESYVTGNVTGSGNYVGGFMGYKTSDTGLTEKSYWDIDSSGYNNAIGGSYATINATGLTTSQMIGNSSKNNMSEFDFDGIWATTKTYPKLKWQLEYKSNLIITGKIETMVADVTIPSVSPDLIINPNLSEGFVAPEFSILNESVSPIKLELKTFEQTTDTFNDVLPSKYESWIGLNKQQSQDIALGLVAKEGEGWQTLTTPISYVVNHTNHEIGIIKPTSSVDFSFDVKHGTAFSEAKAVQYKMIFVFDLMS